MKFKAGDKVYVKPFKEICEEPGSKIREEDGAVTSECYVETDGGTVETHDTFLTEMQNLCGEQVVIEKIIRHKYIIQESCFNFLECWLTDELYHYVDSFGEE
jgi:hypothetical protein